MEDDTDDSNQEEDDYTLDLRSRMAKVREQEKLPNRNEKKKRRRNRSQCLKNR